MSSRSELSEPPPSSANELDEGIDEEVEEERVPLVAADIPPLLKGLESANEEIFEESTSKLNDILIYQEDLFVEGVVSHAPHILKLAKEAKTGDRRNPLVDILSTAARCLEPARTILQQADNLRILLGFLLGADAADTYNIIFALEEMLDQNSELEPTLVDALKKVIFVTTHTAAEYNSAIEAISHIFLYQQEKSCTALLKAGAFEFIINATDAPDPQTRIGAITCLGTFLSNKSELQEHFEANQPNDIVNKDPNYLHGLLVLGAIGCLQDSDSSVVDASIQFLQGDDSEVTKAFVMVDDDAPRLLVLALANKDYEVLGAPIDWLLATYTQEDDEEIREGFRQVFTSQDISLDKKIGVLKGLTNTLCTVARAARKGGMPEFILNEMLNPEQRSSLFPILKKLMDDDQVLGSQIVRSDGIPILLSIFENGMDVEEQVVAASTLALLPDSYAPAKGDDTVSFQDSAADALSAPDVLPRILALVRSDNPKIASAAYDLVAKIMCNSNDWQSEDRESPRKERILTPEFVELVVKDFANPDRSAGAFSVIAEACWAYDRGLNLIADAFKRLIPNAESSFFMALDRPFVSKHMSRKRRRVADAAVKAGAIPHVLHLLKQPITSIEHRRQTVEAFRLLLCADEADMDIGRKNTTLPVLLKELIADGTWDSLKHAMWMVRLLSVEDNPNALAAWSALSDEGTVKRLVAVLQTEAIEIPPPDDALPEEEHQQARVEWTAKVEAEEHRVKEYISVATEIISGLLDPHFKPFINILAAALLTRSNTNGESCVVNLLNKLISSSGSDDAPLEPLVTAAKNLLALPTPPELSKVHTWVASDTGLATAFYLAGVVPFMLAKVDQLKVQADVDPEGSEVEAGWGRAEYLSVASEVIDTLASLTKNVRSEGDSQSRKREVQKAFFSNEGLLGAAVATMKDLEDYQKYIALSMVKSVMRFSAGFDGAIPALSGQDIFPSLLKMFDDDDLDADDSAPLLGLLVNDENKPLLVEMLRGQIAQLKPPATGGTENGGKKKKKKKRYTPRLSLSKVLLGLKALSETSRGAREAIIDAGGVDVVSEALNGDEQDLWENALGCLRGLVLGEDPRVHDLVVPLVPAVEAIWTNEETRSSTFVPVLLLLQAFIDKHDIKLLLDAGWDQLLVDKISDEPSSGDDMSVMLDTVVALIKDDEAGRDAVVRRFVARIADEGTWESEKNWGTSHALRTLANSCDSVVVQAVIDIGALDYAVKMLKADDMQYITKGAALASTLARRLPDTVMPLIEGKGVLALATLGNAKVQTFLDTPFHAAERLDEEEAEQAKDAHEERRARVADWASHWDRFLQILRGENVSDEEYEEYTWF